MHQDAYHLSSHAVACMIEQSTQPRLLTHITSRYVFRSVAYLTFQPVRLALHTASLQCRWALTPPFHLFPLRQVVMGSLFSVALSVFPLRRILPVRKYGALCCPDFPPLT